MRSTRRLALIALVATTLLFAVIAGGAIGTLASGSLPVLTGTRQPPATVSVTPRPPGGSSAPAATPEADPAPSLEPTARPSPEPSALSPTPTVAETTSTPTLQQLEVETPVPEATGGPYIEYVVQPGDILARVAQRFGVSVAAMVELNPGIDPDSLTVGSTLLIPRQ